MNCWYTRVATLYRCDGDGRNIRMLSSNNDHDNTPWMLPDGRVLYMRWEYVDRSQVHFHHLWAMNPDGTGQQIFFGNEFGNIAMLDAKPIPGTNKVVASFSPGHGMPEHLGPVTIVDPERGPDILASAQTGQQGERVAGPMEGPLRAERGLLPGGPSARAVRDGRPGETRSWSTSCPPAEQRKLQCHEPRPRDAPPPRAGNSGPGRPVEGHGPGGPVRHLRPGRNMAGVKRGEIKKLLVLAQLPKPVNFSGGMEPLTIGGTFTLAQIVGTVPVEPDGSAFMEVPPLQVALLRGPG